MAIRNIVTIVILTTLLSGIVFADYSKPLIDARLDYNIVGNGINFGSNLNTNQNSDNNQLKPFDLGAHVTYKAEPVIIDLPSFDPGRFKVTYGINFPHPEFDHASFSGSNFDVLIKTLPTTSYNYVKCSQPCKKPCVQTCKKC